MELLYTEFLHKFGNCLLFQVESERTELLKHPLVTSLLDYKWRKYTRYVYFGNVAVYFLYIAFLTAFALVVHSPLEIPCESITSYKSPQ